MTDIVTNDTGNHDRDDDHYDADNDCESNNNSEGGKLGHGD